MRERYERVESNKRSELLAEMTAVTRHHRKAPIRTMRWAVVLAPASLAGAGESEAGESEMLRLPRGTGGGGVGLQFRAQEPRQLEM
jgi:hypothetical protein